MAPLGPPRQAAITQPRGLTSCRATWGPLCPPLFWTQVIRLKPLGSPSLSAAYDPEAPKLVHAQLDIRGPADPTLAPKPHTLGLLIHCKPMSHPQRWLPSETKRWSSRTELECAAQGQSRGLSHPTALQETLRWQASSNPGDTDCALSQGPALHPARASETPVQKVPLGWSPVWETWHLIP